MRRFFGFSRAEPTRPRLCLQGSVLSIRSSRCGSATRDDLVKEETSTCELIPRSYTAEADSIIENRFRDERTRIGLKPRVSSLLFAWFARPLSAY
jgi:hypothetical protein